MCRKSIIPLFLFMLLASEAWADVVVIMRREAEATGNYVRICDIARVEGPNEQAREVALIVLGPTPPRGQSQEITRWDIETRLFEMGIVASVTFTGNDMVRVFGNGTGRRILAVGAETGLGRLSPVTPNDGGTADRRLGADGDGDPVAKPFKPAPKTFESPVPPGTLVAAMSSGAKSRVNQAIARYLAEKYPRSDMEVEARLLTIEDAVPESAHEIKVEEALGGRVPGKATLRLSVRDTDQAEPRQVVASADTQVYGLALVAGRQLTRGEQLEPRDVVVTRVRMESGKGYLPPTPDAASGRTLKKNVKPGEALLAVDAVPSEAVKRGNLVVVIATGKGWDVKTVGKALGSGMVGDSITVEDASTKAKYPARITGPGTVAMIVPKDRLNKK